MEDLAAEEPAEEETPVVEQAVEGLVVEMAAVSRSPQGESCKEADESTRRNSMMKLCHFCG